MRLVPRLKEFTNSRALSTYHAVTTLLRCASSLEKTSLLVLQDLLHCYWRDVQWLIVHTLDPRFRDGLS